MVRMAQTEPEFPLPLDSLLASVVELLKIEGAAREIAIIAASEPRVAGPVYDNWNGGTYGWSLALALNLRVYGGLSAKERKEAQELIRATAVRFFDDLDGDHLQEVQIIPLAITNDAWREDARAWASGAGINNQGRVRTDNIASRACEGLLFRSQPEIHLFKALKRLGVTFAPLPVFVRGGATYTRLEPDFVVLKDGVIMVVEVDGDTFHPETPAEAHARLQPLDHEGAAIERVSAAECSTPDAAKQTADRLLAILNKRIAQRR